jgi:hypothetical protein
MLPTRRRRVLPLAGQPVLENAVETFGLGDVSVDTVGDLFGGVSVEVVRYTGGEVRMALRGSRGYAPWLDWSDWVWQVSVPLISKNFLPTLA